MKRIDIFEKDDLGYLGNNQRWWFDENHPDSFELFDLDGFYPQEYFEMSHGMTDKDIDNYFFHVCRIYELLTSKKLSSVFEAGCGGGWFTKKFAENGMDIVALEGSKAGFEMTTNSISPNATIKRHDLRRPISLGRKFNICLCTEVAEHIEPPFSSQLISTLTEHSDIVWFSFETLDTNEAHYHHCNEQPEKFWVNLFDFYGYSPIKIPADVGEAVAFRGSHVFYKRSSFSGFNIDFLNKKITI
jgi:SAM-dependent methyltransferase